MWKLFWRLHMYARSWEIGWNGDGNVFSWIMGDPKINIGQIIKNTKFMPPKINCENIWKKSALQSNCNSQMSVKLVECQFIFMGGGIVRLVKVDPCETHKLVLILVNMRIKDRSCLKIVVYDICHGCFSMSRQCTVNMWSIHPFHTFHPPLLLDWI